jgi:hypothetical protein
MNEDARRRLRAVLTCAALVLVDVSLFLPRLVFHNATAGGTLDAPATRPGVPGIGYELGLLVAVLVVTAGSRWRRAIRVGAVILYAAFFIFSLYHEAFMRMVFFTPAIADDWRLLLNLLHFVRDASLSWKLALAPWVLGYVASVALAAWTFRRVQEWARSVPLRPRVVGALAFALVGGALVTIPRRPSAIVQPLSDGVIANVRSSRIALRSWHAIFSAPPDTRYDGLASVPLARRPNVYLLMIEAYGEVLATCPSKTAYHELLDRMEARLSAKGYRARSGYSTAPIYGARSWLTMATVQTGIHIDNQPAFRVLEGTAAKVPTLTSFFKAHGYHTMMLQPLDAPRFGVSSEDLYRRDRAVIRTDLPFRGVPNGLAGVPDQYSLGWFDEHFLSTAPEPRFVFYMAVSTHYPWWPPSPFLRDWHRLDGPNGPDDVAPWPELPGRAAVGDPVLADYLTTVEYEWRVLADFLDARAREDALVIVIGDHQPRLDCPGGSVTYNSPMHVISRDPKLVDLFADVGLTPGLYAEPAVRPPLKHEGLYSLLVSKLTSVDRAPGTVPPPYFPSGIPLSGIRR